MIRLIAIVSMLGMLAACGSSGPAPKDRFYRLTITEGAPAAHAIPGALEVQAARVQGLLSGRALTYEDGNGVLKQRDYHYWSEPPAKILQEAFIDGLRTRNVVRSVTAPEMRAEDRDLELIMRLKRFEQDRSTGRAVVEVELALRRITPAMLLLVKTYHAEAEQEGSGPAGFSRAMGLAVSSILDKFALDVEGLNIQRERKTTSASTPE